MKYTVGNATVSFNLEKVSKYASKDDFVKEMTEAYSEIIPDGKKLKKMLDSVWKEANPKSDKPVEE